MAQHPIHVPDHIVVRNPHNLEAPRSQNIIAEPVLGFIMRIAIDLDDQRLLRTQKVGDEPSDDRLPAKFVTV